MDLDDIVGRDDFLSTLTEADRQGRSTRLVTRTAAGQDTVVGRVVGYRLGPPSHAVVFRIDTTRREVVVEFVDIVRAEMI